MKNTTLIALGLIASGGLAAQAAASTVLYDNSENTTAFRLGPGVEFGDQIVLHSPDPANTISYTIDTFVFEYYGLGLSGDEQIRLRFYQNDGPQNDIGVNTPGTIFFESPFFPISETQGETLSYSLSGVLAPRIFTWAVTITGLSGAEEAGLNIYSPPVVGDNFPTYWQRNGANWELREFTGTSVDFGAFAEGSLVIIPEPGTMAMFGLGALGLLAFHRRFRSTR